MLQNINLNDTKAALQALVTTINRLEGRVQAVAPATQVSGPTVRHGWLGVIRDSGPNGEDNFAATDPRYWVERLEADTNNETTDAALSATSVMDRHDELLSPIDYVAAVNLAECQYLDGGGVATSTGTTGLLTGRIVRVFTLLGAGSFHYFDAGDGLIRCRLDHLSDGVYNAYAWGDPDFEHDPLGTSLQPSYRPFGTSIDFTQYGETGFGYFDDADDFVLVLAIEERYDLNPCPDP
jgi:hypothetical protein